VGPQCYQVRVGVQLNATDGDENFKVSEALQYGPGAGSNG